MVLDKVGQFGHPKSAPQAPKWGSTGNLSYPSCSPWRMRMCCMHLNASHWHSEQLQRLNSVHWLFIPGIAACSPAWQFARVLALGSVTSFGMTYNRIPYPTLSSQSDFEACFFEELLRNSIAALSVLLPPLCSTILKVNSQSCLRELTIRNWWEVCWLHIPS